MSTIILEILSIAVMVMAIKSMESQIDSESVVVRIPVDDRIRRS